MPPRSRSTRLAVGSLVVLTLGFVSMAVLLTPWDPLPGAEITRAPVFDYFTYEQVARSDNYYDDTKWPSWLSLAAGLVFAVAIGFTPLGRRLVTWTRARVTRWWLQVVVLVAAVTVLQALVRLPFQIWGGRVSRDYGLTTQSWGAWAVDQLKSLGIGFALTALGLVVLVGLARRFTRSWFIPAAAGSALLVVVMSFAYPVVFEPVFTSFSPMREEPLRSELLQLADEDGIEVSEVLVADASQRTTALNAYVSGFGATKRIVVYDTLLESAPDSEVELIVAHELGHAANRDVLVGTLLGAVGAAVGMVALFLALRSDRLRRRVGAGSAGDPAVVPLILALVVLVGLFTSPVQNTISRQVEMRADAHSLALTGNPDTFVAMQKRLAVVNHSHLFPNAFLAFWFGSHPTTLDRIGMARAWEDLHDGGRVAADGEGE